jgi:dGTPase
MDWADDVTYSVHDVEDFYRAGLIPLDRLGTEEQEREEFCNEVFERKKGKLPATQNELRQILENLSDALWTSFTPFSGSFLQRQTLKSMSSNLIGDYVTKVGVDEEGNLAKEQRMKCEIFMLKQLTWHYVILNPSLATQQEGQKKVINGLFDTYKVVIDAALKDSKDEEYDGSFRLFPKIYRESLLHQIKLKSPRSAFIRILIDMIAGMTEHQAIHTYHRLIGANTGSPLSPATR